MIRNKGGGLLKLKKKKEREKIKLINVSITFKNQFFFLNKK